MVATLIASFFTLAMLGSLAVIAMMWRRESGRIAELLSAYAALDTAPALPVRIVARAHGAELRSKVVRLPSRQAPARLRAPDWRAAA